MSYDAEFIEGGDRYGGVGRALSIADLAGKWSNLAVTAVGTSAVSIGVSPSLLGGGGALTMSLNSANFVVSAELSKNLIGNYARTIGGCVFQASLTTDTVHGWTFTDNFTDQLSLVVNSLGRFELRSGGYSGAIIATSGESVVNGSIHHVAWDFTFHATLGVAKVWLDNVLTTIDLSGVATCVSANNYFNILKTVVGAFTTAVSNSLTFDHFYSQFFLASGGSEVPPDSPFIDTEFGSVDVSVDFTPVTGVLGAASSLTTATNAPGANRLMLRKYTPDVNCTLDSIGLLPAASSGTVKAKGVAYSDNAGAPDSLLSSGTEVVGMVSGTILALPLTSPQSLTAGTPVWIGYITDTSIALHQEDTGTEGYSAANTYASGAPGTAPGMTSGLASWLLWGNCTAMAHNWAVIDENPQLGSLSYVASSTVGAQDVFGVPAQPVVPQNIYTVAVSIVTAKVNAGTRTIDLQVVSGATTDAGDNPGQAPAVSIGWIESYYKTDPNTGLAWVPADLDAAYIGYKIAS